MNRTLFPLPFLAAVLLLCPALLGQTPERTTITSETLELQGTDERNFFHFRTDVEVRGTNLEIFCDELTVIAYRSAPAAAAEAIGEIGAIESILAVGNVRIQQEGRTAYAGRAEVNPVAGTVTLSENPRIVDGDVEIEGYQFVLFRDQRRFQSIPDPNAPPGRPSRSVVRLGEMPDLGFSQTEESIGVDRTRARDGRRVTAEAPSVEEVDPDAQLPAENGEKQP